ncbi:glycosyltransferase [Verrucomicrobiaceae bacterium 5K15]|uniref:Glycosyltransferase n=1 Tax=Oceaniferula flava TaxID=2800421 RepID=A0AAE2SBS3_9BACT|nr:glycosyltransferase [Oceaniferula flavus]MBK1853371.1 glycosyltransferase [Oceaniferula flavus]MBM1134676.1 glycosyltransferase [Oceaniferula flavus]
MKPIEDAKKPRRMRIEIVTDTFRPDVNGVAMTLGQLVDGLRQSGHLVYVIHTGDKGGKGESSVKSVSLPGYSEVRVGLPGKLKLSKRWHRKRPDVVYVATESPLGMSAIKVARKMEIPVAAGFHTNFHHYMKQYKLGKMQDTALRYLRRVHGLAHCTIAPSPDVRDMLMRDGFQNVKLLGRGVDTKMFTPQKRCAKLRQEWGARGGTPVVMVVGRVAPEKNMELAFEAFEKMQTSVPDMRCVVVGDGPSREMLEQKHRQVHFAGVQRGEDLAKHYASADILLFPSETETFGNVLLEGMASGMVTVAYDYAAARLHVTHGENGLVAPKGDADLFLKLAFKAANVDDLEPMRANARIKAMELGWQSITQTFEGYLTDIVHDTGNVIRGRRKRQKLKVRTLFLSDIHLGTEASKAREVVDVLKHTQCERIVLNGDIIDGWALKRGGKWRSIHTRVVRTLLKKLEKEKVEIVYLRGNHDDFMTTFLPIALGKLKCVAEYIHETPKGDRYLVLHGDGFDSVSTGHKWIAVLGSIGYDALLNVNRVYNQYRKWRGKEYYSVSKAIKARVKSAVNFVGKYQEKLVELAEKRKCQGIICGHIHTPANEMIEGVHYLNSGDWVETLSCLVEDHEGNFEVLYYDQFLERTLPKEHSEVGSFELPSRESGAQLIASRTDSQSRSAVGG